MSIPILNNLNLNLNQLLNALAQKVASDPGSPVAGQFWYNTTTNQLRYFDGTTVIILYDSDTANTASKLVRRDASGNFAAGVITVSQVTLNNSPSNPSDAATKAYVDAVRSGLDVKDSVRAATTVALPAYTAGGNVLTATANGVLVAIDGVTLAVGERLLVKDQSGGTAKDNGIYTVTAVGSGASPWVLTRATDTDTSVEVTPGMYVFVEEGTTYADSGWVLATNAPITLNTTALSFVQFSGAGQVTVSAPLTKTGNNIALSLSARIVNTGGSLDLPTGVATAGTYTSVTVDTYGRVTAGSEVSTVSGFVTRTAANTYTGRTLTVGSGLTISNADGVSGNPLIGIDTAVIARKHASSITGDGIVLAFTVTHNLNTQDCIVQVYDVSRNLVLVDTQCTTVNTCTITFSVAPANGVAYRVVVLG